MNFVDLCNALEPLGWKRAYSHQAAYLDSPGRLPTWVEPNFAGRVDVRRGLDEWRFESAEEALQWLKTSTK